MEDSYCHVQRKWQNVARELRRNQVEIIENPLLAHYTTWRVGGKALAIIKPANLSQLVGCLRLLNEEELSWRVIGNGSNILPRDQGFNGVIIKLEGEFTGIKRNTSSFVECGGGVLLKQLINFSIRESLTGSEFLVGIPGTVGGAIINNAGCFGREVAELLDSLVIVNRDGEVLKVNREEIDFGYRYCSLQGKAIIVGVVLNLSPGEREAIKDRIRTYFLKRKETQPIEFPSAGSVFKNPRNGYAALLIEKHGLKGLRLGWAQISRKHANFVVNLGGATASQIRYLIEWVQKEIYLRENLFLEREVELWD
ncbi:UDP-N-acetylmuramate dehydrogenase [Atrimonas thermophila]|uniref:UDP-N-acetylmuramate dehydrogenase n=1 Tax=Atrimonas thermophila TaxID=3064161 RepID=UPI00399CB007